MFLYVRMAANFVPGANGYIPPGAFRAGQDRGVPLYVARAWHRGSLVPGKFHQTYKTAYVSWGGEEHEKSECELLTGSGFAWVTSHAGAMPQGTLYLYLYIVKQEALRGLL